MNMKNETNKEETYRKTNFVNDFRGEGKLS